MRVEIAVMLAAALPAVVVVVVPSAAGAGRIRFGLSTGIKHIRVMTDEGSGKDDPEAQRFRLLRRAEGYESGTAWADYLGWGQSAVSMYETGQRRVPRDAALQLLKKVPGFDPVW